MKTPKILPWLARRAGVSDSRAELLWRAACLQAASTTGEQDGSHYWGEVQVRLLDLLARERWRNHPPLTWPWLLAQSALEGYSRLATGWLRPINVVVSSRQMDRGGAVRRLPGTHHPGPASTALAILALTWSPLLAGGRLRPELWRSNQQRPHTMP